MSLPAPCSRAFAILIVLAIPLLRALPAISEANESDAYKSLALVFAAPGNDRVVLFHPGDFLDPALDETEFQRRTARVTLLNRMVKLNLFYNPTNHDLGRLYSDILNTAEWAVVPLVSQQRRELKNLSELLYLNTSGTPTEGYKRYLDSKKAYDEVRERYDNTAPDQRTAELQNELQRARDDVRLRGQENTYRPAAARYATLTQLATQEWKATDIRKLQSALISSNNGQTFYDTDLTLPLDESQLAWTAVTLTRAQLANPGSQPKLAGTIDNPDWWRWGNGPSIGGNDTTEPLGSADFTLSFEYAILSIQRDWLDWNVFDSQAWRWKETSIISDGSDEGNTGVAPAAANSIVLVRNVKLEGNAARLAMPHLRTAIRQQRAASFGPFRIVGNSEEPAATFLPAILSATSIRVPFPQVVGMVVRVLPRNPNPNTDFVWPTK